MGRNDDQAKKMIDVDVLELRQRALACKTGSPTGKTAVNCGQKVPTGDALLSLEYFISYSISSHESHLHSLTDKFENHPVLRRTRTLTKWYGKHVVCNPPMFLRTKDYNRRLRRSHERRRPTRPLGLLSPANLETLIQLCIHLNVQENIHVPSMPQKLKECLQNLSWVIWEKGTSTECMFCQTIPRDWTSSLRVQGTV